MRDRTKRRAEERKAQKAAEKQTLVRHQSTAEPRTMRLYGYLIKGFIALAAVSVIAFVVAQVLPTKNNPPPAGSPAAHGDGELKPRTLEELLALPEESLGRVDIARMNLLCATGLPGAENIDMEKYLETLDKWARVVKTAEQKYLPAFYRNPAKYENSLAKFKAIYLVLTIREDLKCGYNLELVDSGAMADWKSLRFCEDSRDTFLHGFIERKMGTCASIPVLAVALGRRCGYPLYLASSKGHLFFRWDDGKERFNVEASIGRGVDTPSDEYYHTYPFPTDEAERRIEKLLTSHTPIEELSIFMSTRGACFWSHGRLKEALEAKTHALRGYPESQLIPMYISHIKSRMNK